jgi:hypothetical protein
MLELYAERETLTTLFEVELEPGDGSVHKGLGAQGAIRTVRNRKNRVQLGVADPVALLEHWPSNERLAEEIEAQIDRFEFFCVRLACSFVPDRGCRFVWARMMAELSCRPDPEHAGEEPVAFDLFPRDILEKTSFKRKYSLTPKLSLAFVEASAEASTERELLDYEPRLSVAGLLTNLPTWTFERLRSPGLVGSVELFLVAKKPKGAAIEARFVVAADVTTYAGRVPLRKYGDPALIQEAYLLSP